VKQFKNIAPSGIREGQSVGTRLPSHLPELLSAGVGTEGKESFFCFLFRVAEVS
jgi:hypothetical protein